MSYIIITKKIWDNNNFKNLEKNIILLKDLKINKIKKINPKIIFFIHWSKYIPQNIYEKFTCIQFHSSNLPIGRGGSPIQNQIIQKIKKTKVSAFKVSNILDSGPICLKENLHLNGNAKSILMRMEKTSVKMIKKLIKKKKINFKKQVGKPTYFKRRKPSDSRIKLYNVHTINDFYDLLRMLDAPEYPKAFIKLKKFNFTFSDIKKRGNKIIAQIEIKKNEAQ